MLVANLLNSSRFLKSQILQIRSLFNRSHLARRRRYYWSINQIAHSLIFTYRHDFYIRRTSDYLYELISWQVISDWRCRDEIQLYVKYKKHQHMFEMWVEMRWVICKWRFFAAASIHWLFVDASFKDIDIDEIKIRYSIEERWLANCKCLWRTIDHLYKMITY